MVARILTGSCEKCKGALKQSLEDPNEWSCMNCGMLFLAQTEKKIREVSRRKDKNYHEPRLPGDESEKAKERRLQVEALEKEDKTEVLEGDDAEWERLNPNLKLGPKEVGRHQFNVCKECGKKGSYTYGTDLNTVYCKYCSPRNPWKEKLDKEFIR